MLRFLAALGVVICHATQGRWMPGAGGVDLFFVISGFIITRVAEGRQAGDFIRDRLTRVVPIYWLALLPWLAVYVLARADTFERTAASLTLWPVWSEYVVSYLKPGWTLSFELLFYGAMAFCLWRPKARPFVLMLYALMLAAGLVWKAPLLQFAGSPIILEFLAGVAIAKAPKVAGRSSLVVGLIALVAGGVWLHPPDAIPPNLDPWRVLYWGLPAALVVYGAVQAELRSPAWKPLVFLGDASYSIYLTHWLITRFMPLPPAVLVLIVLAFGAMVHWYLERPLLKFVRGLPVLATPNRIATQIRA